MTKEEKKSTEKFFEEAFTGFEREVIDEYAKDKAIAFKIFSDVHGWDNNPETGDQYTTEQLFDLFNTNKEV